jgi:hypothetical protein
VVILSYEIARYFLILWTSNTTGLLASGQHIVVQSLSSSQGKAPPNINVLTFGNSIPKALRQIPSGVFPLVSHSSPTLCPTLQRPFCEITLTLTSNLPSIKSSSTGALYSLLPLTRSFILTKQERLKESNYCYKFIAEVYTLIIDYYFFTLFISNTTGFAASEQQAVVASLSFSQGNVPPNESVLILGYNTAKAGKQIPSGVLPGGNIHSSPTLCPAAQLPFCEITFILIS